MKPPAQATNPTTTPSASMKMKITSLTSIATLALAASSIAAPVVYEGFNYSLANNTPISGVAATGTGISGNYSTGYVLQSGSGNGSMNYTTSGLTFSSNFLPATSGALRLSATGGTAGDQLGIVSGVGLNLAAPVTGTLYSSYLVNVEQYSAINSTSFGTRTNNVITAGTAPNSSFGSYPDYVDGLQGSPAVGYDATPTSFTNPRLQQNVTYLAINRFTNVGTALSAGTQGIATVWFLTSAQYDSWITLGGGLENNLSTYATISFSDAAITTGTYNFDNSRYLQFSYYAGNGGAAVSTGTVVFDELRYGTTLADVALVPEPSSVLLAGIGSCLMLWRGRSKRSFA